MEIGLKQKLDYTDFAVMPEDSNTYEILDGELYVTPPPTPLHQRVSKRLQRQLEAYFEGRGLGEVFDAPIGLILGFHDVAQPDLLVVTEPRQISQRGIEGAPALVVEVLSPSTRGRDRTVKARRYAALGVRHYWLVDPEARRVECFAARQETYEPIWQGEGDALLSPAEWPGLTIRLADLWR
ncbi:MAG: Uma2 family endonuclease [Candidatus Rokubacteria bacterium]|nr:Uma2 family endonuclease [Candidatus Rokubacteria bacterium]